MGGGKVALCIFTEIFYNIFTIKIVFIRKFQNSPKIHRFGPNVLNAESPEQVDDGKYTD